MILILTKYYTKYLLLLLFKKIMVILAFDFIRKTLIYHYGKIEAFFLRETAKKY